MILKISYNLDMKKTNFYAVIIGTEILNGRRIDAHFEFIKNALLQNGDELFFSVILKDDVELIKRTYKMILDDPNSMMFSFGGIGSTPDDLTRAISADIFTSSPLVRHEQFQKDILERFREKAYPNRIFMSDLPKGAALLKNPVNNMSGYYLEDRFFFMPGFPEMSHPMVDEAIRTFVPKKEQTSRYTLLAETSEDSLIHLMKALSSEIELSSLPMFKNSKPHVELSLSSFNEELLKNEFSNFTAHLIKNKVTFKLLSNKSI